MARREKGRPWKNPSEKKDHMNSERAGQTLTLGILMNFTSEYSLPEVHMFSVFWIVDNGRSYLRLLPPVSAQEHPAGILSGQVQIPKIPDAVGGRLRTLVDTPLRIPYPRSRTPA
jgi:hypothetical protein